MTNLAGLHAVATPAAAGMEGAAQSVVTGIALLDVNGCVGALEVVFNYQTSAKIVGGADCFKYDISGIDNQRRQDRDFCILDDAVRDQLRNRIGLDSLE